MSEKKIITNQKDGHAFAQDEEDSILRAALRAGIGLSYECNSGGCGGCKFELIDGEIETLWPDAPGLSERDKRKGRHLACQCHALGPITISAPTAPEYIPVRRPSRQQARLTAIRDITHDIREFCFSTSGIADFLPGQYAMLDLPGVTGSRAYSMSNTGNDDGEWHFQIRRIADGHGTQVLFDQLTVGSDIGLDGPYGVAYLRAQSPRDIVCVAGGSGLAPMISIARGAAETGLLAGRSLYFFYGARTVRDVCGEDMLQQIAPANRPIQFIPVVSQQDESSDWSGARGFVHEHLTQVLPDPLAHYEFYFAGPPPMTQAIQELLMLTHQVPFDQIHFDRFF